MLDIFTALEDIGHGTYRTEYAHQIRCPFHGNGDEVNPSARVYPETDSVYCWVCSKSWNPISLIAEAQGLTYQQAKVKLTIQYGGRLGSPKQSARLDNIIADCITGIKTLKTTDKRALARSSIYNILSDAAAGVPTWELEESVREWSMKYFPRLML